MIDKQTIERIIEINGSEEFKSGSYHLYIYWGSKDDDSTCYEESHVSLKMLEGSLEIFDFEERSYTFIPYEEIYEISINPDF